MKQEEFAALPEPQKLAFDHLYIRQKDEAAVPVTYFRLVEISQYSHSLGCLMVPCFGIWYGIETDGYTHT